MSIYERMMRLLEGFDPDQPRDPNGRWTGEGSAWRGEIEGNLRPEHRETVESTMHALAKRYPTLADMKVDATPGNFAATVGAFASKSAKTLYLNPDFLTPEKLAEHQKTWKGLLVNPSLEGTIVHEMGHVLDGRVLTKLGSKKYMALLKKHGSTQDDLSNFTCTSAYGMENLSEHMAETFAAQWFDRSAWNVDHGNTLEKAKALWQDIDKALKE